jgi:hypothetical protein
MPKKNDEKQEPSFGHPTQKGDAQIIHFQLSVFNLKICCQKSNNMNCPCFTPVDLIGDIIDFTAD